MAKLIYSMLTSLDGYAEDEHGDFGWGFPTDEAVHSRVDFFTSARHLTQEIKRENH